MKAPLLLTKNYKTKNHIGFNIKSFVTAVMMASPAFLFAQQTEEKENKPATSSIHYQATTVSQWVGNFNSPYVGSQTFLPRQNGMTISATYFYAHKLSKNTEFVINPEMAGGAGLSGVYGIASFTNAEAMRTGQKAPFVYIARAYVKHNFPLSSETVWQDDGANTIAGYVPKERLSLIVGKFALTDYFDGNSISHDGRTQFFNWSIGTQGAYDFAADNKAYTQGILAELVKEKFKLRYAITQLSEVPNGLEFNYNVRQAFHQVIEIEKSISLIPGKPGVIRALAFATANKYGVFAEAMEGAVAKPFDSLRNTVHFKTGLGLNLEQSISDNISFFARASMNNGKYEAWSYTQIDQSVTAGFVFAGNTWSRPNDKIGIAGGINGISKSHANYLKGGGTGIILGDGTLNYGNEGVFETFYSLKFADRIWLTADYQFCVNPGFNKDRGPIWNIVGFRAHVEF